MHGASLVVHEVHGASQASRTVGWAHELSLSEEGALRLVGVHESVKRDNEK